jgi:3-dehydroquinate dehydratase-2
MKILILNGPNLNLLGRRQPDIYGSRTFDDYFKELKLLYPRIQLEHYQSNHEGNLIDKLHETGFSYLGIVLNGGGYTHTSIALADAVSAITTPVVEVHISDISKREEFRRHSYLTAVCKTTISGQGLKGYQLAIDFLLQDIIV